MATRAHSSPGIVRPFAFARRAAVNRLPAKKGEQTSKARPTRNHYFQPVHDSAGASKIFSALSEHKRTFSANARFAFTRVIRGQDFGCPALDAFHRRF
jgi:hypothetical protein